MDLNQGASWNLNNIKFNKIIINNLSEKYTSNKFICVLNLVKLKQIKLIKIAPLYKKNTEQKNYTKYKLKLNEYHFNFVFSFDFIY